MKATELIATVLPVTKARAAQSGESLLNAHTTTTEQATMTA
jgi:hypothetical protein